MFSLESQTAVAFCCRPVQEGGGGGGAAQSKVRMRHRARSDHGRQSVATLVILGPITRHSKSEQIVVHFCREIREKKST
jgi:hypothetical protein